MDLLRGESQNHEHSNASVSLCSAIVCGHSHTNLKLLTWLRGLWVIWVRSYSESVESCCYGSLTVFLPCSLINVCGQKEQPKPQSAFNDSSQLPWRSASKAHFPFGTHFVHLFYSLFILIFILYISPFFMLLCTTGVSSNHWSHCCGIFSHPLDSNSCAAPIDLLPVSTPLLPADISRCQAHWIH